MTNLPKGKYSIRLLNQAGQQLYRKELDHIGGSSTENLFIRSKLPGGLYHLQVNGNNISKLIKVVKE